MIYIYFNDKNGTIYSADKQRCFSVVFGDDVYASPPLTEAQLADRLGVHQSTISRRKNAAYRKIRKFFEKN